MEVTLTPGAFGKIINEEVRTEKDMIPVLQVMHLRLHHSNISGQDTCMISLSDGTHLLKGFLRRTMHGLVKEGFLQAGSIVRLTQFSSTDVWLLRRIVIVAKLEVISTKSAIIGHPIDHPNLRTMPYDTSGSEQQGLNAAMSSKSSGSRLVPAAQDGVDHAEDVKQIVFERFEDFSIDSKSMFDDE